MEGRRSRGASFDAAEEGGLKTDDMSVFSGMSGSTGSGSTGSGRTGSTLSTFGSRSPKAESDASSVGSAASALMLSGAPFLDTSLKLCKAEAARVTELLSGACMFFEEDDTMVIENIEQLSPETLEARLAVMNLIVSDLQGARDAALSK